MGSGLEKRKSRARKGRNQKRKGRKLNGVFFLDKPKGESSNHCLQRIKRLFNAEKAGHTGSLDPMATGVLPICFGEATKFASFGLEANKAYHARVSLGRVTETGDAEGKVVKTQSVPALSAEQVEQVLDAFRGESEQVPSMFSALKHKGRPLYEYAREGIDIPRPARKIQIDRLEASNLERLADERDPGFELFVACSKGTYIRTLAEDIGRQLGCGAHLSALRRAQVDHFSLHDCHTIEQVEAFEDMATRDSLLCPVDTLLSDFTVLRLRASDIASLCMGQQIALDETLDSIGESAQDSLPGDERRMLRRIYAQDSNSFIGLGELVTEGKTRFIKPVKLIAQDST